MKKKLMMVAVLLGALSLGACVDNDESASVTAVRNAKAEQLKGAAALANAQAEAETIRANAEAKLKEAEAAYQDAKTEADKAKWAAKLTVIQAEAARDIAQAQRDQKDAEMAIITNQDRWINNTLWNNYSNASSLLINLNSELINATADEIALKAGVVSAQKAAEKIAVEKNQFIAQQTERKDQLSKLSSIASDRAALEKKLQTLRVEYTELEAAKGKTADTKTAAQAKFDEAQAKICYDNYGNTDKLSSDLAKAGAELTYIEVEYGNQFFGSFNVTTSNSVEVGENSNNAQSVRFYELGLKSQTTSATLAFQNKIKYIKENIVGVPSDTDKGIQVSGAYSSIEYWAAQKKQKEADKAAATTDAEKAAIQAEIEALQPDIERADEALEAAKEELAEAEAEFKAFQDAVALFANADAKAAYDKDIADAKTLAEALVAASDADDAAQLPLSANQTAQQDVRTLLSSTANVDELIADCDVQIANAKEDIANANSTKTIYVWSNNAYYDSVTGRWHPGYVVNGSANDTAEALHAYMVDRIEALNAQIESQGQIVEKYKKQLDDAIAAL
ncbi:hypothetical protein I6E64_18450 [Bacteroides fragilis]|uniref:hypothetical protein n=1 Tax=Bacteroides fragilis TaxID=817 RepID=UPI001F220916|nr:hypothetical protein [Bacteroides fragilis]MCF2691010.1 hypothetical protein [Bacteroides fragilis]